MLVLDQLRKLAEEQLVELAGYGDVERQGIALLGSTIEADLNQARAAHRRLTVPSGRVQTATEGRDVLFENPGRDWIADPLISRFGEQPYVGCIFDGREEEQRFLGLE